MVFKNVDNVQDLFTGRGFCTLLELLAPNQKLIGQLLCVPFLEEWLEVFLEGFPSFDLSAIV